MIEAFVDFLAQSAQTGNLTQMEVIARSLLASIPEDLVALQFLGLALYQSGRIMDARRVFKRVADIAETPEQLDYLSVCEPAAVATLRAATQRHSGLSDAWYRISEILSTFGFQRPAAQALAAAKSSGNSVD